MGPVHRFDDPDIEVFARGAVRVDPRIGEAGDVDTAVTVMTHADGTITTIDNSREAVYGYDQRVAAFGSEGAIEADNRTFASTRRSVAAGVIAPKPLDFFTERYEAAYREELRAFLSALRGESGIESDGRSALAPLAIGLAAKRSLQSGRPEPVVPIPV